MASHLTSRKARQKASKPLRPKKCGNPSCRVAFTPSRPLQAVCSPLCAYEKVKADKAKKARKELREGRERMKGKGAYLREAQQIFNKYIRMRDIECNCISCGRDAKWDGQWHASHFYATSIRPNLRFNEHNVHKACVICNNYMHGNLIPYRERLIEKIGVNAVNALDSDNSDRKYSIEDLKEIKKIYAKKIREIQEKMQS